MLIVLLYKPTLNKFLYYLISLQIIFLYYRKESKEREGEPCLGASAPSASFLLHGVYRERQIPHVLGKYSDQADSAGITGNCDAIINVTLGYLGHCQY